MTSYRLIFVLFVSALTACSAKQQPWFGVNAPPGLGDPHQPVVDTTQVQATPAPVPPDDPLAPEMDGARIKAYVEAIVGFSKQSRANGDRVWGRVTGFPAAKSTLEWAAENFRNAGLQQVEVQQYNATEPMWWADDWQVKLLGGNKLGPDVILESALPTGDSEINGTLTASPVDVGYINEAIPTTNLDGKIAVQHLRPLSGAYSERGATRERARELMARGAVAVINVVEQIGNMHVRDFSYCNGPCFNLGTQDGKFLTTVIERARAAGKSDELKLQLQLNTRTLTDLKGYNTVGIVPGESDESIIINAHADGWFDAAGDNADGLAVLVALANHFAKPANRLERTLVFVASGGHHSRGLNGPANFVAMNSALTKDAVLVLNLEHVAQYQINATDWSVSPHAQPMSFGISNLAPALVDIGKRGMKRYDFHLVPKFRRAVPGDLGGYRSLGVARVQAIHSGPMYHTSGDVAGTISAEGLEKAARFFAYYVREAAKADAAQINPPAGDN